MPASDNRLSGALRQDVAHAHGVLLVTAATLALKVLKSDAIREKRGAAPKGTI